MQPDIHNEQDFAVRVATAVLSEQRPVVFLLGSGVSLPNSEGYGIPGVTSIIEIIKERLVHEFENTDSYQDAFRQILAKRGQDTANRVIQDAVLRARTDYANLKERISNLSFAELERLESENDRWYIPKGILAVASLSAHFPHKFGRTILTTNFDPLLEVALSRQQASWYSSALHADGSLMYIRGVGTHVVHLHGHWWGSDTLHIPSQLSSPRPQLARSLRHLLSNATLAVVGYGGWDDIFMLTVRSMLEANDLNVDILWGFYESNHDKLRTRYADIINKLNPALQRGRAHFYAGVSADSALSEVFRVATKDKPAQDLGVFLSRVELVRTGSVDYPGLAEPWGQPHRSLGDYLKLLARLDHRQAVEAALFAVEYLLPELERQPIHQAPIDSQFAWIREAISKSHSLLDIGKPFDLELSPWLSGAVIDMHKESNENHTLNSKDRTTLRAAAYAVCACLAAVSRDGEYSDSTPQDALPVEIWAAKSIHVSARTVHDDDGALWGYVTLRLTGGYDHLWRFSCAP